MILPNLRTQEQYTSAHGRSYLQYSIAKGNQGEQWAVERNLQQEAPEGWELRVVATPITEIPSLDCPQHKKLVEGNLYEEVSTASYSENDISNSIKNGILYLEDPIDHVSVSLLMAARGQG